MTAHDAGIYIVTLAAAWLHGWTLPSPLERARVGRPLPLLLKGETTMPNQVNAPQLIAGTFDLAKVGLALGKTLSNPPADPGEKKQEIVTELEAAIKDLAEVATAINPALAPEAELVEQTISEANLSLAYDVFVEGKSIVEAFRSFVVQKAVPAAPTAQEAPLP